MLISLSFLLLLTLLTSSFINTDAEPVRAKRLLFPRQSSSFFGGWGLRLKNCPAETQNCSGQGCCPKDLLCTKDEAWGGIACCPTRDSCVNVIKTLPVCSDPSWTLWKNDLTVPFCCLPNQFGYDVLWDGSSCADPGLPVAASLLAKSLVPAHGTTAGPSRATTTRARSSSITDSADAGGDSSVTDSGGTTKSGSTTKSGLSTGVIAAISVGGVLIVIGIALIAGVVWWWFKKGQKMGRERQDIAENFAPAPEYTASEHTEGGGGGGWAPGAGDVVGTGASEKPGRTIEAEEVNSTEGRREMQA